MRAVKILQDKLHERLGFLHSKRRTALWRVVEGLLQGQQLWLTELGRNLPGVCVVKHRIKAVDRLVGSSAMQMAITKVYAALAGLLLRSMERPVLVVDWSGIAPGLFVLSAKVAFAGRAVTILSRTFPEHLKATPRAERAFLKELKAVIPAHCRPVLVTDAGFIFKWFDTVRAFGWDYVGRVRLRLMVLTIDGQCMRLPEVYALAKKKPRDFGTIIVGKGNPRAHRVVLSGRPKRKGRKRLGRKGQPLKGGVAVAGEAANREPLVLVTSLSGSARVVVDVYRLRMQIEETFRDLKSHRYGWSTRHIRTVHAVRVDVLLLIGALAAVVMHVIGLAIRDGVLARGLQANTERRRRVFSTFFLARLALKQRLQATLRMKALRAAATQLMSLLVAIERMAT
jgi:hypothetical protein